MGTHTLLPARDKAVRRLVEIVILEIRPVFIGIQAEIGSAEWLKLG